ncbi:MAG: hypothetical protein AB8B88_10605 [Devosiaceae bacterium]
MQGLTELGGAKTPKSVRSARQSFRFGKRYGKTLAAIMVPAMVAGALTGFMFSDRKGDVDSLYSLPERVERIRFSQSKTPAQDNLVRTSAIDVPITDTAELVR